MTRNNNQPQLSIIRAIKKVFLSAFVMVTFFMYALQKPSTNHVGESGVPVPQTGAQTSDPLAAATITPDTAAAAPTAVPPTAVPPVASLPNKTVRTGQYKDGTYTGQQIDAQYGLVQVQAVIQNGKIANVQVLQYPNDRRTSARINSIALPWLQQEVIQAQHANVDVISGATLTSEAFVMSLQTALSQAKSNL